MNEFIIAVGVLIALVIFNKLYSRGMLGIKWEDNRPIMLFSLDPKPRMGFLTGVPKYIAGKFEFILQKKPDEPEYIPGDELVILNDLYPAEDWGMKVYFHLSPYLRHQTVLEAFALESQRTIKMLNEDRDFLLSSRKKAAVNAYDAQKHDLKTQEKINRMSTRIPDSMRKKLEGKGG